MTDQKVSIGLELNRAFYEGRGDDFLALVAAAVQHEVIKISETSVKRLIDATKSAALAT